MPCSDRACRTENELIDGSLGTIFFYAQVIPFLRIALRLLLGNLRFCRLPRLPPRILLLARPETREITAAGRAAIRRRADAEHPDDPAARMIVLLTPSGQFLAIAARAARVFPRTRRPYTGMPAHVAPAAPQGINSQQSFKIFSDILSLRNTNVTRSTVRTSELHPVPFVKLYRIGAAEPAIPRVFIPMCNTEDSMAPPWWFF